jgi:hypothetical protein
MRYYTARVARRPVPLKVGLTHPLSVHYKPRRRRDRGHQGMMSYVLEFRIPQFSCCDLALSALMAGLAGVGISRREMCTKLAAVALAGHVAFFIAVMWLRPFTVSFAFGLAVAAAGLGVMWKTSTTTSWSRAARHVPLTTAPVETFLQRTAHR